MANDEYTPYVFYDNLHLAWKGWFNVNKEITRYFS